MKPHRKRLNMHEPAVFQIRIEGKLSENWRDYIGAQAMSPGQDEAGFPVTTLISEPVDQAALVGLVNSLNALGLPLISVEQVN
jgi:hypothetical protein